MKQKTKKVYLSVSYNTSATVIRAVKKLIEEAGAEVLMYVKGERYSTDKIEKSDFVLAIPPSDIYQEEPFEEEVRYNISVGRGQYSEADFAVENDIPYYMLTKGLTDFSQFSSMFTNMPNNWKKDYGNIILKDYSTVEEILGNKGNKNRLLILN